MRKYIGKATIKDRNITLDYFILETNRIYGIEIQQSANDHLETASAFCITRSRAEIQSLATCYMEHAVFPVSLADLVEDYLNEHLYIA